MFNPTFLTLSRHNVFYFRCPIPAHFHPKGKPAHIKVSLNTRNPSEALQLANMLGYHAGLIMKSKSAGLMDYGDLITLLKDYFYDLLNENRQRMHRDGPLPRREADELMDLRNVAATAIEQNSDSLIPSLDQRIGEVIEHSGQSIVKGSSDYEVLKSHYKTALHGYCEKVLTTLIQEPRFTFGTRPDYLELQRQQRVKAGPKHTLSNIIIEFIAEMLMANAWGEKAEEERRECLSLLVELFGADFDMADFTREQARTMKAVLIGLPTNRSKMKEVRDLPLLEQVKVEGVKKLSNASINKYLLLYGAFFKWSQRQGYAESNPFDGMAIKETRNGNSRQDFKPGQVAAIINELDKRGNGLADKDFKFWGTLISVYTGARLNEIASLTAADIRHESGIWYFDINDEEESKQLKTAAAKRRVPVHSALIQRGFLDYVSCVSKMKGENLRLLHEMTYAEKTGWGRKLGRWFNDVFLPGINLKTESHMFHSLRHSAVTNLLQGKVDLHIIRALVGHEQEGVTMEVYNHGFDLAQLRDAIETLKY